jgi:peroxiredoxin Q/BCP
VNVGDTIDDFALPDQDGRVWKLSELLADGPVVLFFYPAAMTYGCTKETCHFRDLAAEFAEVGARRVGISADSVERQKAFADKNSFDFPLLSDPDFAVSAAMGARRTIGALGNRRVTFVIDTDRSVLAEIRSELLMFTHADRALAVLRARQAGSTP